MIYKINALSDIVIGKELDSGTLNVIFDVSEWQSAYPDLVQYHIEVSAPSGIIYLPTDVKLEGNKLVWPITAADTAIDGNGAYQIVATGKDGQRKTSDTRSLYVGKILDGTDASDPPEPSKPWVDAVLDAADRAEEAAKRAESAGGGSVTPEQISQAVEDYLAKNPVEFTEEDPTVPAWAKAAEKPKYTAEEVGAASTEAVERLSEEIAELKNAGITVIGATPLRIERNTSGVILRSDGECAYSIKSDTVIDSDTMTFVEKNGTLTHDGIYEFRPAENQSAWTGGHVTVYIGGLTIGEEYKLLIDCRDVSFDVANYISGGHYRLYKGNANANIEAQFSITENGVTEKTFVATAETQWLRIWPYDGIKYDATKSTARFRDIYINRASAGVERTEIINTSGTFDGEINIGDIPAYMTIESFPACTVCKSGEETGDLDELLREYGMSRYTWQNDVLTVYQNGTKTVYGYHGNNGIMMCKGYGLVDAFVSFKTDILSPMIITASENADGDLDDSYRLTGGNHSYAQTSGTPSANTVLVEVYADGKPAGASGLFNTLTLHARHEVQAWNTEKADGTGRAVLIEDDYITWDGERMNVEIHLTPTENVVISEYYGLQLAEINSCNVYGSKVKKNIATGGYSDEVPYFIEGICNGFRIRMHLEDVGLGDYTYNETAIKYSKNDYRKAYFRPIGESHLFTADDCLWLRGYFEILPPADMGN